MKTLYMQNKKTSILSEYGVDDCCLREFDSRHDLTLCSVKRHHHTEFEIHMITEGAQSYEIGEGRREIGFGNSLIITPLYPHKMLNTASKMKKYALTFRCTHKHGICVSDFRSPYAVVETSKAVLDNIHYIEAERKNYKELSELMIENRVLETIILLLRNIGVNDSPIKPSLKDASPSLSMAKKYIAENAESALSVKKVAEYCHISTRQLSRIFQKYEEVSLFDYIRLKRMERIKVLLLDKELSMREISERMGFENEYYFNAFFKKNYGMPPGKYRSMMS